MFYGECTWKQSDITSMLNDKKKALNENIEDYKLLRNWLSAAHSEDSPINRKQCAHLTIKGILCKKYAIKIRDIVVFIMI